MTDTSEYFGKDLEAMSFAENYYQWIIDEFKPYLTGVTAEVGAGTGNFTSLLLNSGITRLISFEPSASMYGLLAERVANNNMVSVINGYFAKEQGCYAEEFDSIVYVNVLEHVEDDAGELENMSRALRPGGKICIFVPALQWLYGSVDRQVGHYRRYHKEQLETLVRDAGFIINKVKYIDLPGILPWYILFVLFKSNINGGNVSFYDRWLVPVIRKLETLIPPPFGKNLLLVAEKPTDSTGL